MAPDRRKQVTLTADTLRFLEDYQRKHQLPSFSATIEAAALALQHQELRQAYAQYAQDFAQDAQAQTEAEEWLDFPMEAPQDQE